MNHIFDIDGPLMRGMTDLMHLVELNILTLLLSVPVVTGGAAVCAMHFCLMQMREKTDGKILSVYWKQFRGNLRTVTPVWLILLGAGALLYLDYRMVVSSETVPRLARVPFLAGVIVLAAVTVFALPLMGKFYNTPAATLKNAAILAVARFPRTFAMIGIYFACLFLFTQVSSMLPLFFLMGISLPSYLSSFLYWPVLKAMLPEEKETEESGPDENRPEEKERKEQETEA